MHKQASAVRRRRREAKNNLLSDELIYTGDNKTETQIKLIQYNTDSFKSRLITEVDKSFPPLSENCVNWIQICGLSDTDLIGRVGKAVGLHSTDIQDILTTQHIAKVEEYDDKTLVLVNTFYYNESSGLKQEHICFVLGQNCVISFQESKEPLFSNIFTAIEHNTAKVRAKSEDYLFCLLLNNIFTSYIDVVATLEDQLEEMEDELLVPEVKEDMGVRIQRNRHDYLLLKKSIIPLKENFNKLLHNENQLIHDENKVYITDLQDRMLFIIQSIEICRETIVSLLDLYVSNNDLRMNEIMKRLTVVATIFIPLTFVVGVWGMNFKYMPELDWKYGYYVAWAVMVLTGALVWWYLRRRKWY